MITLLLASNCVAFFVMLSFICISDYVQGYVFFTFIVCTDDVAVGVCLYAVLAASGMMH